MGHHAWLPGGSHLWFHGYTLLFLPTAVLWCTLTYPPDLPSPTGTVRPGDGGCLLSEVVEVADPVSPGAQSPRRPGAASRHG